ncbi:hypothetical protein D9613_010139 [Agrocybe pediades]|uniref:Hydrophobin n=1 Tax=Agrocybe pediades TaxID=84607 RepID=A0A8H4VQA8_9AGAR|nr:hypothetical protein D9613_010139 [Agrocybe pediades]
MQFKVLAALAFATVVTAQADAGTGTAPPPPVNVCDTGSLQCCQSTQSATSQPVASLLGLLGIALGSVTGLVGLTCSPITAIGVSGNSCSAQPVCCSNNSFNGIVALGCTPVNVNL